MLWVFNVYCVYFRCITGPPLLSREVFRWNAAKAMSSPEGHRDLFLKVKMMKRFRTSRVFIHKWFVYF